MAGVVAASTLAVWRLPSAPAPAVDEEETDSLVDDVRAIARARGPRVMVLATAAYYVVIGALDVLAVVIAVELLGKREAFAGYLTTAVGVGSLLAGSIAFALIGRRWIAPWILISGLVVGGALVAVSLVGSRVAESMMLLAVFGMAATTHELTARMLLQRVSRLDLIGRVFALVEALQMAMLALGAAIVPLAVAVFGSDGAPAAIGILFAVVVGALGTRIVLIDRDARVPITEMALLRATPLFGALPGAALETVAREARRIDVNAGDAIVRQGDRGMEYYAIVSGTVLVSVGGVDQRELRRGEGFGEIALLRDVPRSATVRAISDAVLLAVDRQPFLTAVTGHAATRSRASSIATAHLDPP
jgi:MFS family permease